MENLTIDDLTDFTLKSYVKLLDHLSRAYTIVPLCKVPREDVPYLILRHDVDISLPAALKMARIENEKGISSTYFVMFSSYFYNLFRDDNVKILKQISKLGHEVGLHYYPARYRSYGRKMEETLKLEIELLEHFLDSNVYSIARHGPWDRDPFAAVRGYINANHPHFRGDLFVHESDRAWTPLEGLLRLLNDPHPPRRVQLLVHAENWQEDKIDRETLLERFIQDLEKDALSLNKRIKEIWLEDPLVLEYDRLMKKETFVGFSSKGKPDLERGIKTRQVSNYKKLFSWYLINTSIGWQIHEKISKIRNLMKY